MESEKTSNGLIEEECRMRKLRLMVDITQSILMQSNLSINEACTLLENTKRSVLKLFPDKEEVYDLIYAPRFNKIIAERFSLNS